MPRRSFFSLSIFLFLVAGFFPVYSSVYLREEVQKYVMNFLDLKELSQSNQSEKIKKKKYNAFSSDEKKFVWFKVYKVASTTLTSFFEAQVPDLVRSQPKGFVPKRFKNYFKFAFVRNPWDRIVSCYFQKIVTKRYGLFEECFDKDFDYFIDYINNLDLTTANPHIRLQTRLIPVDECHFIGKLDHFVDDLQYVCDRVGLNMSDLPHSNQSDHRHYSTYYTPRTKQIIADKYKEDIETFGFAFETK